MLRRFGIAAALILATLSFAPVTPASAAGFTVNSSGDASDASLANPACATAANVCTLRAAIEQANFSAGADVITVPAMTISLGSPVSITSNLTVQGAGAKNTVLAASGSHVMVAVTSGIVTVSGMTVTGASGASGALAVNQIGGVLTLDRMRISGNNASGGGGTYAPVYVYNATMNVRDTEISGNTTTSTLGSTYGGGLAVYSGTVTVVNSTIADNAVSATEWGYGGGVWAGQNSLITVTASTIAGNTVGAPNRLGSGFFQHTGGTGSIEVADSIVADPKGVTNCSAGGKLPVFLARNLLEDTSCGVASATRTIANAQLGALSDNGGGTRTRVPGANSPAIDAASACASPADQRGQARPIAAACDLGATEVGADREAAVSVSNGAPSAGSDIVVTATARNKGADRSTGTALTVQTAGAQILSANVPGGSCAVAGDTATCQVGTVASGAAADVLLTVRVPGTGTVPVTATVSGEQPDPVGANNTATTSATVAGADTLGVGSCSATRSGTRKADVLRGTAASDRLLGKAGNDKILGKGGDDCLLGGAGNDRIKGGPGADRISGGTGKDTIRSKDGIKDRVVCGAGRDTVISDRKDTVARSCERIRRP